MENPGGWLDLASESLLAPSLSGQYLNPSFSPDGRWIVYQTDISSEPAFSPDGRWIVFIRGTEPVTRGTF